MTKKSRNAHMANQTKMASALDDLAAYEDYSTSVLPRLRKAIAEKWSPEKIYKEFSSMVAGRAINIALTESDPGKALTAISEVLNRGHGKAKEVVETTHKYSKLSDDELDNLLASTLDQAKAEPDEEDELLN